MVFLLAFISVVLIIAFQELRKGNLQATVEETQTEESPVVYSETDGVKIPQSYYFHPFHLWIKPESDTVARVGLDDYGRRLVGDVDSVLLPEQFSEVKTGQSCFGLKKDGFKMAMISPISGVVTRQNQKVSNNPALISQDPYEDGWLFKIKSWDLVQQLKSLMSGDVVDSWMSGAVNRLKVGSHGMALAFSQDGGELTDDFQKSLDHDIWVQALRENLGTEPIKSNN